MMLRWMLGAVALATAGVATASVAQAAQQPVTVVAAPAVDEAVIGAALSDVYGVISGPPGQARDWARMRTLFTPDARLSAIGATGVQGGTVEEYIAKSGAMLTRVGFTERELARRVEIYGDLAHAWSSYEGTGDGGKLKVRGINSFQLVRQNGKWLIQSIFWQAEAPGRPVPADMLPVGAK